MAHRKSKRVGRWGSYSATSIGTGDLQDAIEDALREYGDVVFQATEEGITAGAYVLMDELRKASPKIKKAPKGYVSKNFGKRWKVEGIGKYKLKRYVGNSTVVDGKDGDPISLTNIFEYSTTRGAPFVVDTFDDNIDKIAAAVVAEIKKEV